MFQTENLLEQFEITGNKVVRSKLINWCVAISILANIIGILGVYLSLVPIIAVKEILLEPLFYFQLLFSRCIPITALIYFLSKKKFGWSLTVIVYVFDVLQKIAIPKIFFDRLNKLSKIEEIQLSLLLVTFILSVIMVWLLLSKTVRSLFEINKQRLIVSIILGVGLFIIIRFIASPLLVNLAKSRGI